MQKCGLFEAVFFRFFSKKRARGVEKREKRATL
jgi:hypothetical protein